MSDNVNLDRQLNALFGPDLPCDPAFELALDSVDWAALQDEIMQEPWLEFDGLDWSGTLDQGAAALPENGPFFCAISQQPVDKSNAAKNLVPALMMSDVSQTPTTGPDASVKDGAHQGPITFPCNFEGCKAKAFRRKGDLKRHMQKHDGTKHSCTAVLCNRVGELGFYRADKLKDHMIAGHDDNTLFVCPCQCETHNNLPCNNGAPRVLTRDLMSVHTLWHYWYDCTLELQDSLANVQSLNDYRTCPLPKCSYRMFIGNENSTLDPLQSHLLEQHDRKGRENFANTILQRGYDHKTGDIVCPVCCGMRRFSCHLDFYRHFLDLHFHGPEINGNVKKSIPTWAKPSVYSKTRMGWPQVDTWSTKHEIQFIGKAVHVPEDIRQHRRTLLSLWPLLVFYPLWDDIMPKVE